MWHKKKSLSLLRDGNIQGQRGKVNFLRVTRYVRSRAGSGIQVILPGQQVNPCILRELMCITECICVYNTAWGIRRARLRREAGTGLTFIWGPRRKAVQIFWSCYRSINDKLGVPVTMERRASTWNWGFQPERILVTPYPWHENIRPQSCEWKMMKKVQTFWGFYEKSEHKYLSLKFNKQVRHSGSRL